ncbi:hypothetical protein M8J77_016763 [Diaphorina citri]|nr:hypothetical protein M8J77_016763 [Diaphorina citri]
MIFKEALNGAEEGICLLCLDGQVINNKRYADDTVLIATTPQHLQQLINRVARTSELFNMRLNTPKTKIMIVQKIPKRYTFSFKVDGVQLEKVLSYTYLGTHMDWNQQHEIKRRIEMAGAAFNKMRTILCNMRLKLTTRIRVLKCYVFSVLLYGVEIWTLTEEMSRCLEAFEFWCYRRMLRISWIYHVSNETVLERMQKQPEIRNTVKQRKTSYLGHILRNPKNELLQTIIKGEIAGRRGRGRPRISWMGNIMEWTELPAEEIFNRAMDREIWARTTANV